MRRLYTLFIIASLSLASAIAQETGTPLEGNIYYRVRNFGSDRYVYVRDNYDGSDLMRQVGDFGAIELWKGVSTIDDPATVIYIIKYSNGTYNLQAQGTGVRELTGFSVHITERLKDGTYKVYATKDEGIS